MKHLRDLAVYAIAVLVGCGLCLATLFGFSALVDEVQAASPAATDNACVEIGNVRGVYIAHCVDPDTGRELYANSIGFIEVVE